MKSKALKNEFIKRPKAYKGEKIYHSDMATRLVHQSQ